jgi:hypothetical protein
MDIPIRTGDYVSAMRQLDSTNQKLKETEALAGKWVLLAEKHIVKNEDGFGLQLIFSKGDGNGFRIYISPQDVQYYSADVNSLVAQLTEDVIEKLYREQIRTDLTPIIDTAVRNAMMMKDKS